MDRLNNSYSKGFTLIELMIAVIIVAILAAIALPSYQSHMTKTRRATATACLMQYSQLMERYYSASFSFDVDIDGDASEEQAAETLPANQCSNDLSSYYNFSLEALAASTYTLQAVPTSAMDDSACGTLKLNQAGTRTETGSSTAEYCW